ncbi:MAG: hypothetical protein M3P27_02935 [Acidobacteriota bacterium]|nr:hypothetical protein [Acidobacteriota bacterium]
MSDEAICCPKCGAIMVRTGSCYTCPECGHNGGCGVTTLLTLAVLTLASALALAQGNTTKIRAVGVLPPTCFAGSATVAQDIVAKDQIIYVCGPANDQWRAVAMVDDLSSYVPTTRTVNGHALSSNVTVTKGDVSLGNADNTSDANKPVSTAQQTALDAKAALAHAHAESDVTNLVSDLAGKAAASHSHTLSQVTDAGTAASKDVPASGDAAAGEVVKGNDSRLTDTRTPTAHSHPESDVTNLTSDLAAKVPVTRTVNSHALSSDVTVTKSDVSLGNADNTSDANKPVSTATQTALNAKAALSHTHPEADVTSLVSDLAGKAAASHTHVLADVTDAGTAASKNVPASGNAAAGEVVKGNDTRLTDARTPTSHSHPESDVTNLTTDLAAKVAANSAITGATKTKITYDAKGLVTSGADATTADIADSANKRYVTDAQQAVLGNTSGTNTGDQDLSGYVPNTRTVNGHALSSNVSVTASDVGLGSVTNDAQTKAAVVPNTAPSAGQVPVGNAGGTAYAPQSLSQDCTLASTGVVTCTKTNNVSFAASATTDATNAGNIASGTLPAGRMPALTGDVTSSAGGVATTVANIPTATPAAGTIVHSNIAAPSSPTSGKVAVYSDSTDLRFHDKNASGTVGTTVVADTGAASNFLTAVSPAGVISKTQPACADLSNGAASCSTDTTNAANIASGTLPAARLPNPSATTLGGTQSLASVASKWINTISTSGVPSATQPACADLSNGAASCSTDTTNAANIASGTLPAARMPALTGDVTTSAGAVATTIAAAAVTSSKMAIGAAGGRSSATVVTATNPSATASLMAFTITAGTFNTVDKVIHAKGSGTYTTQATQTPTITMSLALCAVSGCGSGTVITLCTFTTAATTGGVTNTWHLDGLFGTAATGASGTLESQCQLFTQLGATGGVLTPESRTTANTAVSSAIDLTAQTFLTFRVLMSTANASNNVKQRLGAWIPAS